MAIANLLMVVGLWEEGGLLALYELYFHLNEMKSNLKKKIKKFQLKVYTVLIWTRLVTDELNKKKLHACDFHVTDFLKI